MSKEAIIRKLDDAGIPYDQFLVDFIEECCSEAYSDGKLDGAVPGGYH